MRETETDSMKVAVKEQGHIKTILPGEQYYEEYRELTHSTKLKYFRKKGMPLDLFATAIDVDTNDLMDIIGGY